LILFIKDPCHLTNITLNFVVLYHILIYLCDCFIFNTTKITQISLPEKFLKEKINYLTLINFNKYIVFSYNIQYKYKINKFLYDFIQ
jgi:hypothetical protein